MIIEKSNQELLAQIQKLQDENDQLRSKLDSNLDNIVIFGKSLENKLQMELLQQKNNFSAFFNSIDDFLFVLDTQGNIIHINRTVTDVLGYSETELCGHSVLMVHPYEMQEEASRLVAAIIVGQEKCCPIPLCTKDGIHIPVETTITFGKWNGKDALFGVSKNLSELKKSESKFSAIFRYHSELMTISALGDGKYLDVNDAFLKKLGYSREEVLGKTSNDLSLFASSKNKSFELNNAEDVEIDLRCKDGSSLTGLLSSQVIDVQGFKYLLTMINDITEKRKIEAELQKSERLIQTAVEETDRYFTLSLDLLCIADTSGRFIRLNPEWEKVLGYSLSELEGSIFLDLVHPDDIPATLDTIARLSAQEQVLSFENRYRCKDGSYCWIEWRSKPFGELIYAAARDVTIRKNNEVKLNKYAEDLKEANATKDKFISIISHDLRGPFQGFLGISDLLANEIESLSREEINDMSRHLNKALNAQFNLLNDLLSWSRINSGKMKFDPVAINPETVISYTCNMLESLTRVKNIILQQEIEKDAVYFADQEMIKLVLRNLISNAIKFTNTGGTINIKVIKADKHIRTEVIDNGIGIEEDNFSMLFKLDKHFTTDGTSNEKGTGLGLILCKEIITKHGGDIWVESIHGKGSTFIFTLPYDGVF